MGVNKKQSVLRKGSSMEIPDNLNISYVGNFYNHGEPLAQWATGFVLLLIKMNRVKEINVLCPTNEDGKPDISLPEQVKIHPCYDVKKPFSLISLLKQLSKENSDIVFFNLNSTSFGNNSLTNLIGLTIPFFTHLTGKKAKIIYHSSVITNDPVKLGYNSFYDRVRKSILFLIEASIFRFLNTFVLLDTYKATIDNVVKKNRVKTLKNHYLEAMPTVFINGLMDQLELRNSLNQNDKLPTILLPGSWGPQKNLELALKSLKSLDQLGYKFRTVITGGANSHFPGYIQEFNRLISEYGDIITERIGYVPENEVIQFFLKADLILMPYNTSGGQSGILEMAAFFEVPLIGVSFAEYEEKRKDLNSRIVLTKNENFEMEIQKFLETWRNRSLKSIKITDKVKFSTSELSAILDL